MALYNSRILERKAINMLQAAGLIGAMFFLMAGIGWLIAGPDGLVMLGVLGATGLLLSPRVSPGFVMRLHRAVPISPHSSPRLYAILRELSRRAELPALPLLFYVPSGIHNAFAVGSGRNAAIGITAGILDHFSEREIAGILAHEVSHIRNRDTIVMSIADAFSRFTAAMANIGMLLLFLNFPLMLVGAYPFPWMLVLILNVAPLASTLLQLGLSRSREFNADLEAASLTGDPRGLAAALHKLEQLQVPWWHRLFFPYGRAQEPSMLRTHPSTEERIERLLELEAPNMEHLAQAPGTRYLRPVRPAYRVAGLPSRVRLKVL